MMSGTTTLLVLLLAYYSLDRVVYKNQMIYGRIAQLLSLIKKTIDTSFKDPGRQQLFSLILLRQGGASHLFSLYCK